MPTTFATQLPLTAPGNPARDALLTRLRRLDDAVRKATIRSLFTHTDGYAPDSEDLELSHPLLMLLPMQLEVCDRWLEGDLLTQGDSGVRPADWATRASQRLGEVRTLASGLQTVLTAFLELAKDLEGFIDHGTLRDGAEAGARLLRNLMRSVASHHAHFLPLIPAERTRLVQWMATMAMEAEKLERIR